MSSSSTYLIELCDEGPVYEFITFLHRNSKVSDIFLKSISSLALNDVSVAILYCQWLISKIIFQSVYEIKLLKCVEHSHPNRSGQVLKLLIPNLLKTQAAVSRMAANLASRKIELLLTMSSQEVLEQFSDEDLISMRSALTNFKLIQK